MKQNIKDAYNKLGHEYYKARKYKKGISHFYNECLEMPTTLRLLGNVKSKKILDVGCGPGIYARILSENGAKVKGIDISKRLIEIANKEAPESEFTIGNAEELPYKDKEFDIVMSALMLGHIEDWNKIFSEIKRVLKPKGIFVFSITNPIVLKTVKRNWFFKTFDEITDYFNEGWIHSKWSGEITGQKTSTVVSEHHKTYGTIVRVILSNGFEIIDYEDSKPIISSKKGYPKQYIKTINRPNFCTWKVQKK